MVNIVELSLFEAPQARTLFVQKIGSSSLLPMYINLASTQDLPSGRLSRKLDFHDLELFFELKHHERKGELG